jgi:hypothetical protein
MRYLICLFLFWAALSACSVDDTDLSLDTDCGVPIQLVDVLLTVETDTFQLLAARAVDRCLEVTIEASGCSTDDWTLDLVSLGEVAESMPTQTSAQLLFDDGVEGVSCEALLQRSYFFDLRPYLTEQTLPSRLTLGRNRVVDVD